MSRFKGSSNGAVKRIQIVTCFLFMTFGFWASPSSASAEDLFYFEKTHTILDASGAGSFELGTLGVFGCKKANISGLTFGSSQSEQIRLVPSYTECTSTLGPPVHMKLESCALLFHAKLLETHAPGQVDCTTPGDEIRINVTFLGAELGCARIPEQTSTSGGVGYGNTNGDITATSTVTGLEYTAVSFCGSGSAADNGSYSGTLTLSGTDTEGQPVDIAWNNPLERFHFSSSHSVLGGSAISVQDFETTFDEVECGEVSIEGSVLSSTSDLITVTPSFEECDTINGGVIMDVKMRSCDFELNSEREGEKASPVKISCSVKGDEIRVVTTILGTESVCLRIPPQQPTGGGVFYTNVGGQVAADIAVTGLEYTEVGTCDEDGGSPNAANDGVYEAEITLAAKDTEGGGEEISWE